MYFHDGIYELCWTYKIFYKKSKQLFIYDFIEINFFYRTPSRIITKSHEISRSRQDLSMIKFVSNSQSRRGPNSDLAAARSSSQSRRSRSREDLRRSRESLHRPISPAPQRPSSRASNIQQSPMPNRSRTIQQSPIPVNSINSERPVKANENKPQNAVSVREIPIRTENETVSQSDPIQKKIESLQSRINEIQKEKEDLHHSNMKLNTLVGNLEKKNEKLEIMLKEKESISEHTDSQTKKERDNLLETNKILQATVAKVQHKVDKLELENEDLKINYAVMKAEKHNAISALENFKNNQRNVTDEIGHLYKLNSEQAVRITEFEKEKKLNAEEFAYLYKIKNEQANKIKEIEKDHTELSQFHKTISDQAIRISELQAENKTLNEKFKDLDLESKVQKSNLEEIENLKESITDQRIKIEEMEKFKIENELKKSEIQKSHLAEIESLKETISVQMNTIKEMENMKNLNEVKLNEDDEEKTATILKLKLDVDQLRKTNTEQSVKIVELENNRNEKKENLVPRKDLMRDISKLKEHYLEIISNWKSKCEETKMLLHLRDQELEIYKKRGIKKSVTDSVDENEDECRNEAPERNGYDTVDENEIDKEKF